MFWPWGKSHWIEHFLRNTLILQQMPRAVLKTCLDCNYLVFALFIYACRLSRCSSAREGVSCLVGPTKVNACKSLLFPNSFFVFWNKEHLVDFVVILNFTSLYAVAKCHKLTSNPLSCPNCHVLILLHRAHSPSLPKINP